MSQWYGRMEIDIKISCNETLDIFSYDRAGGMIKLIRWYEESWTGDFVMVCQNVDCIMKSSWR